MKLFRFIVLVLIMLAPLLLLAEEPPNTNQEGSSAALKSEDAAALREGAAALGRAFGVKTSNLAPATAQSQPTQPAAQPSTPPPTQKSLADVADKALDMTNQAVATVASNVEKVAPTVWRIMVVQQFVKGVQVLVVPWGLFATMWIFMRRGNKALAFLFREGYNGEGEPKGEAKEWEFFFGKVAPLILCFIFAVWGVNALSDAVGFIVNPAFYAIQDLLKAIINPGT